MSVNFRSQRVTRQKPWSLSQLQLVTYCLNRIHRSGFCTRSMETILWLSSIESLNLFSVFLYSSVIVDKRSHEYSSPTGTEDQWDGTPSASVENELDGRAVPAALRLIKKKKTPTLPWNRLIGHTLCEGGKNYVNLIELFQERLSE